MGKTPTCIIFFLALVVALRSGGVDTPVTFIREAETGAGFTETVLGLQG
jgi:hypothetical protein